MIKHKRFDGGAPTISQKQASDTARYIKFMTIARKDLREGYCREALSNYAIARHILGRRDASRSNFRSNWKLTVGASQSFERDFASQCLKRRP